eukprot:323462-Amphidinium_carterae.1
MLVFIHVFVWVVILNISMKKQVAALSTFAMALETELSAKVGREAGAASSTPHTSQDDPHRTS